MYIDELATPLTNLNVVGAKQTSGVSLRKFINSGNNSRQSNGNGTTFSKKKNNISNNSAFADSIRLH